MKSFILHQERGKCAQCGASVPMYSDNGEPGDPMDYRLWWDCPKCGARNETVREDFSSGTCVNIPELPPDSAVLHPVKR